MKPFSLEEAKAGKPVCTRDGKDVRIICWDWKNPSSISIIALVKKEKDGESIQKYTKDGRYYADGSDCDADLFMKPEKHEGWGWLGKSSCVYTTKEDALSNAREGAFLAKVEWEE
jgi:hypothetical protein